MLELTGADLRSVIAEYFEGAFPWLELDAGYKAVSRPADAQGNHVISLTPDGSDEITYTLDPKTFLPIRAAQRRDQPQSSPRF